MGQTIDNEQRLELSLVEKSFRHRQKFLTEITLFALTLICSVWFTMNILMNVNRKRDSCKKEIKELKGQPKNPSEKKND